MSSSATRGWTPSRWLVASIYIAVGWTALGVLPTLWSQLGVLTFALLILGGLLYSVGALVYSRQRPDPAPAAFGYHEVFHALVLAAGLVFYAAILRVVFGPVEVDGVQPSSRTRPIGATVEDPIDAPVRWEGMARTDLRHPANAAGEWFVDTRCIDCGTCRDIAPGLFADDGGCSIVAEQPTAEAELGAWLAAQACPTSSIGTVSRLVRPGRLYPWEVERGSGVWDLGYCSEDSFGASAWLATRPAGNVLVDSPRFTEALARPIDAMGGIDHVLLTHRDDVADAARVGPTGSAPGCGSTPTTAPPPPPPPTCSTVRATPRSVPGWSPSRPLGTPRAR